MPLSRRDWLAATSVAALWESCRPAWARQPEQGTPPAELRADVLIVGGGLGGCAAALAACRDGVSVIMTEPTDWIGGQLTSQAVPLDEHKYIEKYGCNADYRTLREAGRDVYRRRAGLKPIAKTNPLLNPGNGWVSRVCAEPRVWLEVLETMLAPHVEAGRLTVLREWQPIAADADRDRIRSVTGRRKDGRTQTIQAKYILDATEEGDLLPLAKVEHVTGSESQAETGEPSAAKEARPSNIQSFTWVFALEHRPGEKHIIDKPERYDFWRDHVPQLTPPSKGGKQLSWSYPSPKADGSPQLGFDPENDKAVWGPNLWTYRRALDAKLFDASAKVRDISLINWAQNDYHEGPLHAVPAADAARHSAEARQLSLALLYWLQTEAPRADGGVGWPGLCLRPDVMGTSDGIAKAPYIRESRRIRADFTVKEQHVAKASRPKVAGQPPRAEQFADTVGVGLYLYIDIHATSGGDNGRAVDIAPFQIPLGSLIPVRVENLIPACKNLGVTHITNGCYRLHPVEWGIGEAAGTLAAHCVRTGDRPKQVRATAEKLAALQSRLTSHGVELTWPSEATN